MLHGTFNVFTKKLHTLHKIRVRITCYPMIDGYKKASKSHAKIIELEAEILHLFFGLFEWKLILEMSSSFKRQNFHHWF